MTEQRPEALDAPEVEGTDEELGTTTQKSPYLRYVRLFVLVLLLVGLALVAKLSGLDAYVEPKKLKVWIQEAGSWGVLLYIGVFSLGELLHVPGLVFVAAGVYVYGKFWGGLLAIVGAIVAVSVSFLVVRIVGGKALAELRWDFVRKILEKLEERPIATVIVLRFMFLLSPGINYALGLSSIRFRDYFLGSALGLLVPLSLAVIFIDWLFK